MRGRENVRHEPLLCGLRIGACRLPKERQNIGFGQAHGAVGDQCAADDGGAERQVVADHPKAQGLGGQAHAPATQERIDEGHAGPRRPIDGLVQESEDNRDEGSLAPEVRR